MSNILINNYKTTLVSPIGAADTQIYVGHSLPALGAGDYYLLTLFARSGAEEYNWEIVKVTAAGGSTLTVTRGQEGTAARDWGADTLVEMRLTAGQVSSKANASDVYTVSETDTLLAAKQATLVSGTDIKTINGTSLLGSGDITTPTTTVNNTLTSTSTTEALSAAQGKVLQDNKLSIAGGTMTGAITSLRETKVAMAANNIDLSLGNFFTKTISGATTLTRSNVPATGQAVSFILELTKGGSATITWFSGVKWAGGTAPTLTSAGVDILGFYSHDGGTTWRGMMLSKDSK